jgi:hypothetical protein
LIKNDPDSIVTLTRQRIHRLIENFNILDSYAYLGQYETYSSGGYVFEHRGFFSELENNFIELHQSE